MTGPDDMGPPPEAMIPVSDYVLPDEPDPAIAALVAERCLNGAEALLGPSRGWRRILWRLKMRLS